ncbi:MAG: DNA polymerase III subunit alpha [Bacteroidaceae bacterium]|nr:DNA polymerase III subunit alpha [Bacteroidaceae bacterium]
MPDFVHLHVHTQYSLLDGQASIAKLLDKASADGMRGMAITDHGNMMGVKEFCNSCDKLNKKRKDKGLEPFKPIIGCEMYVAPRNKESKDKELGDGLRYHLIVLAKNLKGYHNLVKLVSRSWIDGFYNKPRTDHHDLELFHEGLIICSACIAGEVPRKIYKGDIEGAEETIRWYKGIFGEDYYLELQRHEVKNPNQRANRETYPIQQQVNKVLIELARKYDVKLICTNDVHFVDEDDAEAHDRLICLSTSRDLDDPTRMLYSKQEWFKTKAEMAEIFADVPEAMENTIEILDKVEFYSIDHAPIMPNFAIPESFGTEEQYHEKFTDEELFNEFTRDEHGNVVMSEEEAKKKVERMGGVKKLYRLKLEADYLAHLTYIGAKRIYGNPIPNEIMERLNFELHVMKSMGFPGYFLIVQDYINAARHELKVSVGPGRGSAAGSAVAYCLGITQIDPIQYDLLFERFLNPDRISLPDIDVDFDDDGRGKVLSWVTQKYGDDKVAHIITYGTMATKLAIKDVARVEKLPLDKSNELCKLIPDRMPEVNGETMKMNLSNVISIVPELQRAESSPDKVLSNTIRYAKKLEGNVRNTGVHACGVIICKDDVSDWVPISTADDKETGEKLLCTQYEGSVIEETGLIKMDFLGLKTLSQIKECQQNIRDSLGIEVNVDKLNIKDPATFQLYCDGRTVGTFQFESAGMQKYLRELQPSTFEDLIAMNALYRPGPMDYIPDFIDRKQGRKPVEYDIPCMEKYLKDTYGITVYQEQVMLLSRQLANFTRGESDTLRKAMGKKLRDKLDHMKPKFINQGKDNGHDPKALEKIWTDWEKFASYAFNKSHATCYSWIAYQTAYLKANYPAQFMAGIMSRSKDITEVSKFMNECKGMGIETLGPDVNYSRHKFSVDPLGNIRFGLTRISGLGASAVEAIVKERDAHGPYRDIFDFAKRVPIGTVKRNGIECLALSGAFDCFSNQITREQFFAQTPKGETFIDVLTRFSMQYQQAEQDAQFSLFKGMEAVDVSLPAIPEAEPWTALERLSREKDKIGIYLSAHPLDEYSVILNHTCNLKMETIADLAPLNGREVHFGGIVTAVRKGISKSNKPYGIATIEDYSGPGELPLFGDAWPQWSNYMQVGYTLYITGRVQPRKHQPDRLELVITNIEFMANVKDKVIQTLTISFMLEELEEDTVFTLSDLARKNPGKTKLAFNIFEIGHNARLQVVSTRNSICVTPEIIDFLDQHKELAYKIN